MAVQAPETRNPEAFAAATTGARMCPGASNGSGKYPSPHSYPASVFPRPDTVSDTAVRR